MITVNQLKTPDSTVGAHLSLRAMHETLAILSLRAPLRGLETENEASRRHSCQIADFE